MLCYQKSINMKCADISIIIRQEWFLLKLMLFKKAYLHIEFQVTFSLYDNKMTN